MSWSSAKPYLITGLTVVVAVIVAMAISNRVKPVKKLVTGAE